MSKKIENSQVAEGGSKISNSNNEIQITTNKIRKEAMIISFIVGFISSLLASYLFEHFLK